MLQNLHHDNLQEITGISQGLYLQVVDAFAMCGSLEISLGSCIGLDWLAPGVEGSRVGTSVVAPIPTLHPRTKEGISQSLIWPDLGVP